jgi:hypothetical protein
MTCIYVVLIYDFFNLFLYLITDLILYCVFTGDTKLDEA